MNREQSLYQCIREQSLCQHILESAKSGVIDAHNGIKRLIEFDNIYDKDEREQLKIIAEGLYENYCILNTIFWDEYSRHDTDCEDSRQLILPLALE